MFKRKQKNRNNNSIIAATLIIFIGVFALLFFTTPAFAVNDIVETNYFGNVQDDQNGCGVYTILGLILDILTFGVAIAAIIGIAIAGTQYLTAKGNEEQTRKAKMRIFEIVLGLIAYAVLYAGLQWLLPNGKFNGNPTCSTVSDAELAKQKKEEKEKENQKPSSNSNPSSSSNNDQNTNASSEIVNRATTETGKKMLAAADYTARYFADNKFVYFQYDPSNGYSNSYFVYAKKYGHPGKGHDILTWKEAKKYHCSHCSSFVSLVEKKAGLLKDDRSHHSYIYDGKIMFKNDASKKQLLKHFKIVHGGGKTLESLAKKKKIAPGDVFGYPGRTHTMIYAGKANGKYWIYEVNAANNQVLKYKGSKVGYIYRTISGSSKVGDILHGK